MLDVAAFMERLQTRRQPVDSDHSYEKEQYPYNVPIAERLSQFRHEGIGCDIEFVVGTEEKVIKAHRLVLGSGSKVFSAMFYGNMTEAEQSPTGPTVVKVPDVTPCSFQVLVDFLYSDSNADEVTLDDGTVMQTLYAAKKYDIRSLVFACVRHLLKCLTAANAVCLLAQARLFDEPYLISHCFDVIDEKTDEALSSPGFFDTDCNTLSSIIERNELEPSSELVIFKALKSWSEAECQRQNLSICPANQRQVLGNLLSLVRFPLMTLHEFGEAANTGLLTCEEITEVFLHLTVVPKPSVSYPTGLRWNGRSRHVVKRFPILSGKRYSKRESRVCFKVDRDILVIGFGVYGFVPATKPHLTPAMSSEWQTRIEIQLFAVRNCPDSLKSTIDPSGTETVTVKGITGDSTPVLARFSKPVPVVSNCLYAAGIRFLADATVQTYGGREGAEFVSVQLPFDEQLSFQFSTFMNPYCTEDNTRYEGQLPEIYFYVEWPERKNVKN